jgi:hypothetical protein
MTPMEMRNNFDLRLIPPYKILFVVTSRPDYEMNRVLIAENYPDYGSYVIVSGYHCSCFGFDETQWDAMLVDTKEAEKVLTGWIDHGTEVERRLAELALPHL